MAKSAEVAVALAFVVLLSAPCARAQTPDPPTEGEAAPEADHPPRGDDRRPVRVGALVGGGFPRPLAVEALVEVSDFIGLGAEYGVLPTITIDGVQTSLWSLAGDARVFPFRGPFFVGLRAGRQHVDADTTVTVTSYGSAAETLALESWFINPRVGLLWTTNVGFTIGVEAGVQIPFAASTTSSLPLSLVPGAQHTADALASSWLPTVDLLRVGFLF
jgi:hypothetical protein